MRRCQIRELNPNEILLENILNIMSDFNFSKRDSMHIVGGEKKLTALIASGEVEVSKPSDTQHDKWFCNAAQVLRHCRNTRPKSR